MEWKTSRRGFLKFTGFTVAGLTLGEVFRDRVLKHEVVKEGWGEGPGVETWPLSICRQCSAGCGIRLRVVDGNPKKIEGNPLCPVSRGKLCPKGEASLQVLFDPDRWVGPVRREGKKRTHDAWQKISWETVSAELTDRLSKLRKDGKPERLMWLMKDDHSNFGVIVKKFMKAYGSPNLFMLQSQRDPAMRDVFKFCQGTNDLPAYDFEKCTYILSFGTPLLESWLSPVWLHRMFGGFRQGRVEGRGRFVHLESRLSPTALKADEWIAVPPGSEGKLALAIAHVLIHEDLYNREFVHGHCEGFEDWTAEDGSLHEGFKSFVLSGFAPGKVEEETGVSVTTLIRLAREFSSAKSSIAVAERGELSNGFFTCWAVHCLNALVGRIDHPGGVLTQRWLPTEDLAEATPGSMSETKLPDGNTALAELAGRILNGKMEIPEILILSDSLFLETSPGFDLFVEATGKIPLVVTFSPFKDNSSYIADLVLPDHTFLEKWQDHISEPRDGTPRYAVAKPAIPPLLDTKDKAEVLLGLAQEIGGTVKAAFPWKSYPSVLRDVAQWLYKSRSGTFFTTSFESSWVRHMEAGGWWEPQAKTFDEFWDKLLQSGGWHDPLYLYQQWARVLKTSSGKFTLFNHSLKEKLTKQTSDANGASEEHPFVLYPFHVLALGGIENPNQPFLQEILSAYVDGAWSNWVELNPKTADLLGVRDGEYVWVESPRGKVKIQARLYHGTASDVVPLLIGNDHLDGGRWVRKSTFRVQDLLVHQSDPGKSYPLAFTTRVKVTKA